jgi:hypothetical protein
MEMKESKRGEIISLGNLSGVYLQAPLQPLSSLQANNIIFYINWVQDSKREKRGKKHMAQSEPGTTKSFIHVIIEIGSKCSLIIEIEKVQSQEID